MKKNKFLYGLTAALLALSLFSFAACDSGSSEEDEDDIHTTLEGKTFVAGDCTLKVKSYEYASTATGTSTTPTETSTSYSVSKIAYIVGESDDLVTACEWVDPSSYTTKYSSNYLKYSISGETITFTTSSGKTYTATITGDNTFTVPAEFIDGGSSYYDITDDKLTFTMGDKPEKATFTKK